MSSAMAGRPRILLVKTRGRTMTTKDERARREQRGEEPRSMFMEQALGCDILDEAVILGVQGWRGALYRRLPAFAAQAIEASRRAGSYDVVMTWSERHSVAIAALFTLLRVRTPHLALMFWMSKPAVRIPLKLFRSGIDRIITWSSVQRAMAVDRIGFRPEDVVLVRHPVDLEFFRPLDRERTIIFSAGSTQRDFRTLALAARGVRLPVRIAASLVVVLQGLRIATTDIRAVLDRPENVEVESMNPVQVREAYAEAKVVVVPLLPSDIDAGVNVILEGMAMGRPVIVSQTAGQVDVIRDGDTGVFVPPCDAKALRSKIESILADPAIAEDMGRRARAYVEQYHRLEDFVEHIGANAADLTRAGSKRRWGLQRKVALTALP
jgi:glycosyltransferase involved in cell wall biosynthesis